MWKDERSEAAVATVWKRSQFAQVYRSVCALMHALLLFTQQLRNTTSRLVSRLDSCMSFKGSVGQKCVCVCVCVLAFWEACKRFPISLSKWNDADVLGLLIPSVSVPHSGSLVGSAAARPWVLWKSVYKVNPPPCCDPIVPTLTAAFSGPFSTFSFTRAPTHVHARTLTERCTKL